MNDDVPSEPLVSVLCATYQHAPFIKQCVRSLCTQETSFEYEVIVRDDASTDGTAEILVELVREFPGRIRLVLEPVNRYAEVKPFDVLSPLIRGKYVAFCEGDDYWITSNKLEQCVQHLESDVRLVLVGHLTKVIRSGDENFLTTWNPSLIGEAGISPIGEMPSCHTSSVVIRSDTFLGLRESLPPVPYEDVCIKLGAAKVGYSLVIDEIMSSYRIHPGGITSHADRQYESSMQARKTSIILRPHAGSCVKQIERAAVGASRSAISALVRKRLYRKALALWMKSVAQMHRWEGFGYLVLPPKLKVAIAAFQRVKLS